MTTVANPVETRPAVAAPASRGSFAIFWERLRKKRLAMLSLVVIFAIYGGGLFAPVLAPHAYTEQNITDALQGPSAQHWFGTDRLGRDMFSRALYSSRTTLIVSAAVMLSGSLLIGNGLGLLAGYRGGAVDATIMRVGEVLGSLPSLPMLILINAAIGTRFSDYIQNGTRGTPFSAVAHDFSSYITVFMGLSLFFWIGTARIVRAQILQLREREFIIAARALGAGSSRIIAKHLLPNVAFLIILQISGTLGAIAGTEVALSWFGVGVQPPTPSFGAMIYEGSGARTFQAHPHLLLVPGLFVSALLFAFALLGDAVNDVLRDR